MMDQERLANFLLEVSKDPERLAAIRADPDGRLAEAGLSQDQIDTLKSNDPERIRAALTPVGETAGTGPNIQIMLVAVIKF